jgi:hypothetical protein
MKPYLPFWTTTSGSLSEGASTEADAAAIRRVIKVTTAAFLSIGNTFKEEHPLVFLLCVIKDRDYGKMSLIVSPHPIYGCGSPNNIEALRFVSLKLLTTRSNATMFAPKRFEHAPFHYELNVPANRWLPEDFRVKRCALVRQRILRCRPVRGLYYKGCDGLKPACSYISTEET